MQLQILSVCQYAEAEEGTLSIEGAITVLPLEKFPARATIYFAMHVRFELDELGPHQFGFALQNLGGDEVIPPITQEMNVRAKPGLPCAWITGAGVLENFDFAAAGNYELELKVDGKVLGSAVFCVVNLVDALTSLT